MFFRTFKAFHNSLLHCCSEFDIILAPGSLHVTCFSLWKFLEVLLLLFFPILFNIMIIYVSVGLFVFIVLGTRFLSSGDLCSGVLGHFLELR